LDSISNPDSESSDEKEVAGNGQNDALQGERDDAVSSPANVATDPSSLAKAKATMRAIESQRTIRRSSRSWYLRLASWM
jgi:hypothetical protein